MKLYKNSLLIGTATLILAGLLTRLLGFYYRIFLSARIGAEGIGLYQMIFPLYILAMSISSSGTQLAICQLVSKDEKHAGSSLLSGLLVSLPISLICSVFMFMSSNLLANYYLNEPRCQPLLIILSLCIPLATIHNCINGYHLGKQNAFIPGITQLIEQIGRIVVVYIIFRFLYDNTNLNPTKLASIATIGLLASELISSLFSLISLYFAKENYKGPIKKQAKVLTKLSLPITLTNVSLSITHSIEAAAIPLYLHKSGLTTSEAISVYGILTAMAMPFILFPTTITCAVAKMLLPIIAKAKASKNQHKIEFLAMNTLKYCTAFGILCTTFFILFGHFIGSYFFNSPSAGDFITTLAWLCPFVFISSTLGSILNGLGFTKITFYHNLFAALLRLSFIIFLIPTLGIKGYLWGILASELLCSLLHTISVVKYTNT